MPSQTSSSCVPDASSIIIYSASTGVFAAALPSVNHWNGDNEYGSSLKEGIEVSQNP